MKPGKYIILRATESVNLRDPFSGSAAWSRGLAIPGAVSARVEVETLNRRDIADLTRDPDVAAIAPPVPVQLIAPKATESAEVPAAGGATWGVTATRAHRSRYSGKGIAVAILDTGIDADHPAFHGVHLEQQDFTGEGNGDRQGHGTHVAGTIFGQDVGGFRFGIARGIERGLIGKVLNSQGQGSTEQIYRAILWALESGAHVISMSLGMNFPGLVAYLVQEGYPADLATSFALEGYRANVRLFDKLTDLVYAQAMMSHGVLLVAAAGNESQRDVHPDYELAVAPPAAADGIISVGALEQTEDGRHLKVAAFSNTGPNISGQGVGVFSAWPGGRYANLSGTSMATPHVSGIAALWAEQLLTSTGRLNTAQFAAKLIGSAKTTALARGYDPTDVGAGLVQAP